MQRTDGRVEGAGGCRLCGACVSRVPEVRWGRWGGGGVSGGGEEEEEAAADEARKKVQV